MRRTFPSLAFLALSTAAAASAGVIYSNTTTDTFGTLLFSVGPYTGIGDQIQLTAASNADTGRVQMYNSGGAGTFDAILRFYQVGAPVGTQIGSSYTLTGIASTGGDVIDLTFALGTLALPQDLIFVASVNNVSGGMDLGLNMFEPPTVGSSGNAFLIVHAGTFSQSVSASENVFFELSVADVPEPSTVVLIGFGLAAVAFGRRAGRA